MIASKKLEKLEHSAVKLSLTLPGEESRRIYDQTLKDYSANVRIDGFRKGHVPPSVLERKFGDAIRLDAMGRAIEAAVEEAIKDIDEKPLAYASPVMDGEPVFAPGQDFSFAVTYDVFPRVEAPDWKGLSVELPEVSLTAQDEERELAELRERNAIVVERGEGAKAAKGDVVTVDYRELDAGGQLLPGTERSDFTFEIGTGYNLYKFDEDVTGMVVGEAKTLDKTFPADFEYKELAGKSVRIGLTLTKIKEKKLPALDDDFAQDVSEKYKTLADLKADIRQRLQKTLDERLRRLKEQALIEGLLARFKPDLPRSMVDAELGVRLEGLRRQMGADTQEKFERFLSFSGKTPAALVEDWRPSAEKALSTRLILEKLVEDGAYECGEAQMEAEIAKQAAEASLSAEEVKAEYQKRGGFDYLKQRIKEDKLMDAMLAAAEITKGKSLSFMDLMKDNE